MKKRLIYALLAVMTLTFGYGCAEDNSFSRDEIQDMINQSLNGQWQIVQIEVKKEDWQWVNGRYECVIGLPELTSNIYEEGAILGYLFLGEQGVDEVQKTLPYVFTYNDNGIIYTETISYDVMYKSGGKSNVAFYIQASDLGQDDNVLPPSYFFRLVLIW